MLKLTNDKLTCEIDPMGAEVSSLKNNETGKEYIWQGEHGLWNRHAPLLFPCVGRMNSDSYTYKEQRYYLQKHGFARNLPFQIIASNKSSALLRLKSDNFTKQVFPFDFELDAAYSLSKSALECNFTIKNLSDEPMYFSFGFHPGFNIEIGDKIEFSQPETMNVPYLNGSDVSEDPNNRLVFNEQTELVLSADLFEKGSLALEKPKSKSFSLVDKEGNTYLTETYNKANMVWLWANPGANFVCIEPWSGSDERYTSDSLVKKKGIVKLDFGKIHELTVEIKI